MNGSLEPIYYGAVCTATPWLAVLWLRARLSAGGCTCAGKVILGLTTGLSLLVPVAGRPLWNWAYSICPNPSLPMLGVVAAGLWRHLFGVAIFKRTDWRAIWIFGATAGTVLYIHPLCLGGVDLYYWGWHPGVAAWGLAAIAVVLLAGGNRLGLLLLAALVGYRLGALESHNGWDYIIGPFYWLISLGMLGGGMVRRGIALCSRAGRRPARLDKIGAGAVATLALPPQSACADK